MQAPIRKSVAQDLLIGCDWPDQDDPFPQDSSEVIKSILIEVSACKAFKKRAKGLVGQITREWGKSRKFVQCIVDCIPAARCNFKPNFLCSSQTGGNMNIWKLRKPQ